MFTPSSPVLSTHAWIFVPWPELWRSIVWPKDPLLLSRKDEKHQYPQLLMRGHWEWACLMLYNIKETLFLTRGPPVTESLAPNRSASHETNRRGKAPLFLISVTQLSCHSSPAYLGFSPSPPLSFRGDAWYLWQFELYLDFWNHPELPIFYIFTCVGNWMSLVCFP